MIYHWVQRLSQVNGNWLELLPSIREEAFHCNLPPSCYWWHVREYWWRTCLWCVFPGYWKSFDTIDHDILIQKLRWYGIDVHELDWFKHYLYDRKQCVRVDNITSDVTSCPIGVPQGSILRPILFLFAQCIENQNCDIFADDAMIYSFRIDIPEI